MSITSTVRTPREVGRPTAAAAAVVIVFFTVVGALFGGLSGFPGPRYAADAVVLFTGLEPAFDSELYSTGQYPLDRIETWAKIAESDAVADVAAARAGRPIGSLRGAITADGPSISTYLTLTVQAPDPDLAVRWAEAAASATADTITQTETLPGSTPRVSAEVISVDDTARDTRWPEIRLGGVIGGVLGLLIGWTVAAIRRPGTWADGMAPPLDSAGENDALRRIDQKVQIEVLGALLLGQSGRGVWIALAALFGIFGYAYTGSPIPPLLVVVAAGIAGFKDLRFAAGGVLYAGVSALPVRVHTFDLGGLIPTVLEVSLGFAVIATLLKYRRGAPRGAFTGPVLALVAAVLIGVAVGFYNGGDTTSVISDARSLLVIVAFFVVREAFRDRPYQLFALLVIIAAASSVVALLSLPLNLELIQNESRSYVITGSDTADVTRLGTPVLELWSPLLVILAAGVIRLRPSWLWALLLVPCLALQALSFNRSTWATLLALAVVVAVLRGGRRGLVTRATAFVVVAAIGMGALAAGLFGVEGQAIALRFTSVVTGDALGEDSLSDRLKENVFAWQTLTESPIVGTGISVPYGRQDFSYDEVRRVREADYRPWIHNQYLRVWLWMGVAGLLAYGWIGVRLISHSWVDRARRGRASTITVAGAAGLGAIAAQAVFQTSLDNPSTIISIAVMLALIEQAGAATEDDENRRMHDRFLPVED